MVRLAAAVAILAPIDYVRVVFEASSRLLPCTGCYTEAQLAAAEQAVSIRDWIALASAVAWLAALLILGAATWRADRRRLAYVVVAAAGVALVLETLGVVSNIDKAPEFIASKVSFLGILGLVSGITLALVWSGLTARRPAESAAGSP